PSVVLTAPFGQSFGPTAPYSTRTGIVAPGHRTATNTWRNNFGIQKGIGCPAEADTIRDLLANPAGRLACPHIGIAEGQQQCGITGTKYRGDEHSIWLRMKGAAGYGCVDLNTESVYAHYLR